MNNRRYVCGLTLTHQPDITLSHSQIPPIRPVIKRQSCQSKDTQVKPRGEWNFWDSWVSLGLIIDPFRYKRLSVSSSRGPDRFHSWPHTNNIKLISLGFSASVLFFEGSRFQILMKEIPWGILSGSSLKNASTVLSGGLRLYFTPLKRYFHRFFKFFIASVVWRLEHQWQVFGWYGWKCLVADFFPTGFMWSSISRPLQINVLTRALMGLRSVWAGWNRELRLDVIRAIWLSVSSSHGSLFLSLHF